MKPLILPMAALGLALCLPGAAAAYSLVDGGTTDFDYQQFPFGPYNGSFHADGQILAGVGANGGTVGTFFDVGGEHWLVVLSAVLDGGGSIDGAMLLVRSATPIAAGVYPVDPVNGKVLFAFVDNAVSFAIPADPTTVDWQAWFETLVASRKFVGASGAITLENVATDKAVGSFSGLTIEFSDNTPVSVANGSFRVTGGTTAVDGSTWGHVKADYRD
ncbi:hypothetical protein K8I85_18130 [bacterium]|nr:hypothetical protein [bacterium]